ncbi:MAG: MBL fold metallo-hydrolase [archaeon]
MPFEVIPLPSKSISSNCYLVLDEKRTILIDSGCDERLIGVLKRLGIYPEMVTLVINTHCHYDHLLCNEFFTEAKICMHAADARQIEEMNDRVTLASMAKVEILPKIDKHLKDGDVIETRNGSLTIIHTPGHTAGSICILASNGALFSGDTVFADSVGRFDFPTGDREALQKSLRLLSVKRFNQLFPGHGGPTTKDRIKTILEDGIIASVSKIP